MSSNIDPLVLIVGRKKRIVITDPWRFEIETDMDEFFADGGAPVHTPSSQYVRLFVRDKLYATMKPPPRSRYSRRAFKIQRPVGGDLEIYLTKKYSTLKSS